MLRLLFSLCMSAVALAAAPQHAFAGDHAAIAPYLTDDVAGVAVIELQRIDIRAFVMEATRFGVIPGTEAAKAEENAAATQNAYDRLEKLGVGRACAVLRVSDLTEGGMTWLVEVERGGNAEKAAQHLNDLRQDLGSLATGASSRATIEFLLSGKFAAISERLVAAGSPKQIERVRELQANNVKESRPDVLEALAGLGDADAGLALVGDADSRRVIRELFPQLPPPFAAINGKLLADDVRWVGATVKFPPKFQWSLVVEAATPEVAGVLEQAANDGMSLAKGLLLKQSTDGPPAHRERANTLLPLLSLVKPRVEGKRLSITFGDDEKQIAFMRDFLPAMTQKWREEDYRNSRMNTFKQIILGLLNYASAQEDVLLAASNRDASGRPLLSWRVHILPYMEGGKLYNQFHLDEPWDSAHNRKLIEQMPEFYQDPDAKVRAAIGDPGRTTIVAPVGEGTVFGSGPEGMKHGDIKDGSSNTIAVVEVVPERAVVWTKPDDWQVDMAKPLNGVQRDDREGFVTGWYDGHAAFIPNSVDPDVFRGKLTYAGGEATDDN